MKKSLGFVCVSVWLFLCCSPAGAQFELGIISGVITDPAKAPVPGATIEIRSLTTNVKRQVTVWATGEYNSLPLQPDRYRITVRQQGFRERTAEVALGVSQRLQADFALELGTVNEQVNVSASAVTIETASSEIGQVRAAKEI